jgi:hypothetical protein
MTNHISYDTAQWTGRDVKGSGRRLIESASRGPVQSRIPQTSGLASRLYPGGGGGRDVRTRIHPLATGGSARPKFDHTFPVLETAKKQNWVGHKVSTAVTKPLVWICGTKSRICFLLPIWLILKTWRCIQYVPPLINFYWTTWRSRIQQQAYIKQNFRKVLANRRFSQEWRMALNVFFQFT